MNELTRRLVTESALKNKRLALANDTAFAMFVDGAYWLEIMYQVGIGMKERAMHLYQLFKPERFDEEGFLQHFNDDIIISAITERRINVYVASRPELQLEDWGDLPQRVIADIEEKKRIEKEQREAEKAARRELKERARKWRVGSSKKQVPEGQQELF